MESKDGGNRDGSWYGEEEEEGGYRWDGEEGEGLEMMEEAAGSSGVMEGEDGEEEEEG